MMSSDPQTIAFILEQTGGSVTSKPMFGEYGLYLDGKMVAMVCDDTLFVKPTPAGRTFAGGADEAPPYPGAKPCLRIPADRWRDADWLTELLRISASALPPPKARRAPRRG